MAHEIKKMDRRYQIFISSTFRDLDKQRKKAVEVIADWKHIPIALERFSAKDESDLEVITKVIADCQIYLLILGHRYGEIVPGQNISFTELEYNLAIENRLLVLILQMDPEEVKTKRSQLDSGIDAERKEIENAERFRLFQGRIAAHHRQLWKTDGDFKYEVARALANNLPDCDKRGFILEPEDSLVVEATANPFMRDLVTELRGFETLYARISQEEQKKRVLAKCFRQNYADLILRDRVNLFFESGSTVAYVARELSESLVEKVHIGDDGAPNIKLSTNNVLAYLLLWLKMRIPCSPFPWSTPSEEKFGAWYGGLEKSERLNPDYSGAGLNAQAKHEIDNLLAHQYRPRAEERTLLLAAASGLQISKEHKMKFKDGLDPETREDFAAQVNSRFGPHVGSYHNKIFKRFMYDTKVPIMIFLTADKIDCTIDVGRCHFILDDEFTWDQFLLAHPLAFCIGCFQSERKAGVKAFGELGFEIIDPNTGEELTAFIARNRTFIQRFEQSQQLVLGATVGR